MRNGQRVLTTLRPSVKEGFTEYSVWAVGLWHVGLNELLGSLQEIC